MKSLIRYLLTVLFMLTISQNAFAADEIDLQFIVVTNDGTNFDVKIQCKRNNANWDRLGSSNFPFYFNTAGLDNPSLLTAHNFSGGLYDALKVTDNGNWVQVSIVYNGSNGSGTAVPTSWIDVATVHFEVLNASQTSGLTWRTDAAYAGYDDDESTTLDPGTFNDLDTSLPVQLSSFTVKSEYGKVTLFWTTQSEINNLGFNLYRSDSVEGPYQKINGELIKGAGNSTIRNDYSYIDNRIEENQTYYYKLEDIDIHGRSRFHGPVDVFVELVLPKHFSLEQNYPNPFNPETTISYTLPENSQVRLQIFNMRGEVARELVNGKQPAGFYNLTWNGTGVNGQRLPSGIYFCKIEAGAFIEIKKMVFTK